MNFKNSDVVMTFIEQILVLQTYLNYLENTVDWKKCSANITSNHVKYNDKHTSHSC